MFVGPLSVRYNLPTCFNLKNELGTTAVQVYFNIALVIISVALIAAILLQSRGGGLGSVFGGDSMSGGQYKTRRGLEKTLFQVPTGLSVAFFRLVIISPFSIGRGSRRCAAVRDADALRASRPSCTSPRGVS